MNKKELIVGHRYRRKTKTRRLIDRKIDECGNDVVTVVPEWGMYANKPCTILSRSFAQWAQLDMGKF